MIVNAELDGGLGVGGWTREQRGTLCGDIGVVGYLALLYVSRDAVTRNYYVRTSLVFR